MFLISVLNLKEIYVGEGCFFWLKFIVLSQCKEEKCKENRAIFRNTYFKNHLADFTQIWYAKSCI